MNNLVHFIMNIGSIYSFIFVFKKLVGYRDNNIFLELKYVVGIYIFQSVVLKLTTKSIDIWIYYMIMQIVVYFLYKELYKQNKFKFILYYIITFWTFQVSEIATSLILTTSSTSVNLLDENMLFSKIIPQVMIIFISILLAILLIYIKNNDKKLYVQESKLLWIYSSTIITIYILLIYYYNSTIKGMNIIVISILVLTFFIFISYFMFTILNNLYLEKNIRNYFEMYNDMIEESLENMNIYKHDQNNILLSIGGFLDNNDMVGLKKYFYEDIVNNQNIENRSLNGLVNIKNSPVKGLIYAKIIKANLSQVNLHVNIHSIIETFFMKDIDICKILGILIDNAIEASVESSEMLLNIGIWNDQCEVYIIISNSFKQEPIIYKMFEKGYSTKGTNRGLGLSIVKDFSEKKYTNMTISTKIEDNLFHIEITIKK